MINYIDKGSGEPLILLHGLGQRYDKAWIPQYNLSEHYRLIIPSLRGHYNSGIDTDITLENMAKDIIELIQELGLNSVYICGLSLGGIVAQEMYRQRPEMVKGLILANSTFYVPCLLGNKIIRKLAKVLECSKDELIERIVNKDILHSEFAEEAKQSFYITDSYLECSKVALGYNYFPVLLGCKVPVMLIGGVYDLTTPIFNTYVMNWALSNAKVKIFNSSHLSNFDCRDEFNNAIKNFLR